MKLFASIRELVESRDTFVILLIGILKIRILLLYLQKRIFILQLIHFLNIDEVESLATARKSALSGTEPSDAIRVVNALLTQLDHLKDFENVLLLATSNITGSIGKILLLCFFFFSFPPFF
jgi:hypothetical protein